MYIGDLINLTIEQSVIAFFIFFTPILIFVIVGFCFVITDTFNDNKSISVMTALLVNICLMICIGIVFCCIKPNCYKILHDRLNDYNISASENKCEEIIDLRPNELSDIYITSLSEDGREIVKPCNYRIENDYLKIYELNAKGEFIEINLEQTRNLQNSQEIKEEE